MNHSKLKIAIIIFGKYPVQGFVKTRLATTVGDEKALEFYKTCLSNICRVAGTFSGDYDTYFYYTGADNLDAVRQYAPNIDYLVNQTEGSLTERIKHAFSSVHSSGHESILIFSTDIPEITSQKIKNICDILNDTDAVIGPDNDGGYYCLGMKRYNPELLEVVYGGTTGMLELTIQKARELNVKISQADTLSDIDNEQDLEEFRQRSPELYDLNYAKIFS
jgi:uncharacterized protein